MKKNNKVNNISVDFSIFTKFYNYPRDLIIGHLIFSQRHRMLVVLCCAQSLSRVQLFAVPWTIACQAPLGFSRQGYWSGQPFPFPGGLPDPGIELESPALQADPLPAELQGNPILVVVIPNIPPSPYTTINLLSDFIILVQ